MSQRDDLLKLIKEKKVQLTSTSKNTEGWKSRKTSKSMGVAQVSKTTVLKLQKEINDLSEQVRKLDNSK